MIRREEKNKITDIDEEISNKQKFNKNSKRL